MNYIILLLVVFAANINFLFASGDSTDLLLGLKEAAKVVNECEMTNNFLKMHEMLVLPARERIDKEQFVQVASSLPRNINQKLRPLKTVLIRGDVLLGQVVLISEKNQNDLESVHVWLMIHESEGWRLLFAPESRASFVLNGLMQDAFLPKNK